MLIMRDHRRYERVSVNIPATIRQSGRFIPATILNLSEDGMLVVAGDCDVSSGAQLEATFDLAHHKDVSVVCRVRHCERTDDVATLGVQFKTIASKGCRVVRDYVSERV